VSRNGIRWKVVRKRIARAYFAGMFFT